MYLRGPEAIGSQLLPISYSCAFGGTVVCRSHSHGPASWRTRARHQHALIFVDEHRLQGRKEECCRCGCRALVRRLREGGRHCRLGRGRVRAVAEEASDHDDGVRCWYRNRSLGWHWKCLDERSVNITRRKDCVMRSANVTVRSRPGRNRRVVYHHGVSQATLSCACVIIDYDSQVDCVHHVYLHWRNDGIQACAWGIHTPSWRIRRSCARIRHRDQLLVQRKLLVLSPLVLLADDD